MKFPTRPLRYGISSGLNWLADFVVFIALFPIVGIPIAMLVARLVGGGVSFASHKWLSFESRTPPSRRELIGFAALWLTNYAIATALVMLAPEGASTLIIAAKAITEVILFVVNYFVLRRLFLPT